MRCMLGTWECSECMCKVRAGVFSRQVPPSFHRFLRNAFRRLERMVSPMIRITVFLLFILDLDATAASTVTSAKEECRKRIAECTMNGGGSMPVCGSDGVTYSNQCQVISKQCQGVSILIKHTGPCPVLKGSPAIGPIQSLPFNDDHPDTKEESDVNDCISDRKSVLEDQKRENLYVPQCMSDGRYHRVQCYSGYCWCVYQDTGKPIPGTSSKDRTPNCNPVPTPSRPMKGCPEFKKQLFLRDLMDLMQEKMEASIDSNETTVKWQASKEERIATWHFVMLDKNKNKVLEKKEWKSFRTMVANNRQLRRCGKKLPRYCDINNDRRISMTEWLSCLNTQRPTTADDPEKTLTTPKRIGPNPLDQFLNDDD